MAGVDLGRRDPIWRPDGKELYYIDPSGAMMAAPIIVNGSTLEPGKPVRLFSTRIVGGGGRDTRARIMTSPATGDF